LRFESADKGAQVTISYSGEALASGHIGKIFMGPAGLGETLDIGRDIGVAVTDYPTHRGAIEGDITYVVIDFD
jgi:arylsulfatase